MRSILALVAAATLLAIALPASAMATTSCVPCDPVDQVCQKVFHVSCVKTSDSAVDASPCVSDLCDFINHVCGNCLPHASESRCFGEVCDAGNAVCRIVLKASCLG